MEWECEQDGWGCWWWREEEADEKLAKDGVGIIAILTQLIDMMPEIPLRSQPYV